MSQLGQYPRPENIRENKDSGKCFWTQEDEEEKKRDEGEMKHCVRIHLDLPLQEIGH